MSRTILVDDTDSGIKYVGHWTEEFGTQQDIDPYGPPYNSTLHGINSQGSLSLQFIGDSVSVLASLDVFNNTSLNPTWTCFLDGVKIANKDPPTSPISHWTICNTDTISLQTHSISVNATAQNGYNFWLDVIEYTQPANSNDSFNGRAILVQDSDPGLVYSSGWEALLDVAHMTNITGSSVDIKFTGTSVVWYGAITYPENAASATYSIDNQSPISFIIQGLPPNGSTLQYLFNQPLFTTPELPPGQHTMSVVYRGDNQKTPLIFDYLAIEGESSPGTTAGASASAVKSTGNQIPLGALVGSVLGGISILLLILAIVYILRRRKSANRLKGANASTLTVPHPSMTPFPPPPEISQPGMSEISLNHTVPYNPPSPWKVPFGAPPPVQRRSHSSNNLSESSLAASSSVPQVISTTTMSSMHGSDIAPANNTNDPPPVYV